MSDAMTQARVHISYNDDEDQWEVLTVSGQCVAPCGDKTEAEYVADRVNALLTETRTKALSEKEAEIAFAHETNCALQAQQESTVKMREALKLINGQCIDFEHGDDNIKAFVRGLGKHADAAIRSLKAEGGRDMSDWLPIESAPKDGAMFLASEGDVVGICLWAGEGNHGDGLYMSTIPQGLRPTRWMPLPAPPVRSGGDNRT